MMRNFLGRVAPATRQYISTHAMVATPMRFYRDNDRFNSFKSHDQDSRQGFRGGYNKQSYDEG